MKKLILLGLMLTSQVFAYEQIMSCSGPNMSLDVWSFTGSQNVEIKINDKSYDAKRADIEAGKVLISHDESNHPFVYETYLERVGQKWKVNKYWLCLGYYFEERGCVFDELRLEKSLNLTCHEND